LRFFDSIHEVQLVPRIFQSCVFSRPVSASAARLDRTAHARACYVINALDVT